ncbi:hypothetical protein MBOT_20160 [Mycobacterium botniense]|uniref:NlpC/P60 domain-containing protein n=1 Tax=Mycobacterium botniense TaxID=84962 RepID=A0A7I9XXX3_9MYCO|nr:hypothetical protein MBOT_20160 [Mycobacterium botniense]
MPPSDRCSGLGTAIGGIGGAGVGLYHQLAGHSGGGLRAPGPKGKDSALFWGADGEHVLTADDVDAMGGHGAVYAFRRALHRQGGGAIGPDVQAAYSMIGTPYSQATRHDCSGMVGRVIAGALGIPNVGLPTTVNMGQWLASLGFRPGIGGPGTISVGWYDHGGGNAGHAAMTLSDGENAEAGGSHGNFVVGAGAAGANSPQFDHHMFLPIGDLQGPPATAQAAASAGAPEVSAAAASAGPASRPAQRRTRPAASRATRRRESRGRAGTAATSRQRDSRRRRTPQRTQSNRQAVRGDRLDHEIEHLHTERDLAQRKLEDAERGAFHPLRGGANSFGGLRFGAPLAEGFGLSGGVKGLGEWLVTFLADLAIGPIEGAMLGNAIRSSAVGADYGLDAGLDFGAPGGYADLGDYGTPLPPSSAATAGWRAGGDTAPPADGSPTGTGAASAAPEASSAPPTPAPPTPAPPGPASPAPAMFQPSRRSPASARAVPNAARRG